MDAENALTALRCYFKNTQKTPGLCTARTFAMLTASAACWFSYVR